MNKWLQFFTIFCNSGFIISNAIIVRTENGLIEGRTAVTVEGKNRYHAFQGIPYAEPPVGNLRFEPPVPKKNWHGTLSTKDDVSVCMQNNFTAVGSEDCLYLSVYTPRLPHQNKEPLPVMVWIYGGGFIAGGNLYWIFGPDHFLDQDVIVVMPNYRLGIFGFLSLGDTVMPGNNGLKDQVLALKWVRKNIAKFGGDPKRTTVFGQSAGSASVSYLLQSPRTKGLFQHAIMESGTSLCLWAFSRKGTEVAKAVGRVFQINTTSSRSLVEGLRGIEAFDLLATATSETAKTYLSSNPREGFIFAPVIEPEHEGAFLTKPSHDLLRKGQFHKLPIMVGYNSLELGTEINNEIFRMFLARYDIFPSWLVPIDMNLRNIVEATKVGEVIKRHYFGNFKVAESNKNVQKYVTDDQFVRPIQEFGRLASNHTTVYFYVFGYEGNLGGVVNRTKQGVGHSEELGYLWRRDQHADHSDALTRARMIRLWTNFAKIGNPTPNHGNHLLQNKIWKRANSHHENLVYLDIGHNLEIKENPQEEQMNFWTSLYRTYGHPPYDSY